MSKINLASTYHCGKDLLLHVDEHGNVRAQRPGAAGRGRPIGYLQARDGEDGYLMFQAIDLATRSRSGWHALKALVADWLADRERERMYGGRR